MNGQQAPKPPGGSHEQHQAANSRKPGRWHLPWGGCIAVVVLALFVGSLLSDFAHLRQPCTVAAAACLAHGQLAPGDVRRLHGLGLSPDFYATYSIVIVSLAALGYWLVAGLLFWRRSGDRLARLSAVSLALFPMVFNPGANTLPSPWWLPAHVLSFLGSLCLTLFFYVFPSGHFVPSFMRWVTVVALLYWGCGYFFPAASFNPFSRSQVLNVLTYISLLGGFVVVQLYRYRRVSGPLERQQTKWVVYGVSLAGGGYLVLYTLSLVFPSLFLTGSLASLIEVATIYGFALLIPLTLGLAILRSRLWEIDRIINRTLAYGTLTAILALVYVGLVVGLSALLRGIISQDNSLAIVLSTLAIAALCQPLRSRIRQVIDRRFYRRKYNAASTLTAFSVTLRHEVELDQVSEALLAVVQETMQPAHLSLWLRRVAPERQREQREQKQATGGPFSQNFPVDVVEVQASHLEKE